MWNAPRNTTPEANIAAEHWRVLELAVQNCLDRDPRRSEVYAALDYFRARALRHGGISVIEQGLHDGNAHQMRLGIETLRRHLGGVVSGSSR